MRLSPRLALFCAVAACSGGTRGRPQDAGAEPSDAAAEASLDAAKIQPIARHGVVQRDCSSTPLGSWYVVPTPVDDCPLGGRSNCGTPCIEAGDCIEQPFGRCIAMPEGRCEYVNGQSTRRRCTQDRECTLAEGGRCVAEFGSGRSFCQYSEPRFNQRDTCALSSDCKLADQGRCVHEIDRTSCNYQECLVDDDCGAQAACVCDEYQHHCVPANCRADTQCPLGHRCRPSQQLLGSTDGLYCTADADPCERDADCARRGENRVCAFDKAVGRWDCLEQHVLGP